MASNASSSSTVRRILSRWGRSTPGSGAVVAGGINAGSRGPGASTRRPATEPPTSATSGRSYSETVKAGKIWKAKAKKQMNRNDTVLMEMMTIDELNGQLLPIHQVSHSRVGVP